MTGDDLRKKIEQTGISYTDLAEKLKISPQALNSRLNAKEIKLSFILDLSQALGKGIVWFYGDLWEYNDAVQEFHKQNTPQNVAWGTAQVPQKKDNKSSQAQEKKIAELEARLKDKEETIKALKKLVDLYEQREQNKLA